MDGGSSWKGIQLRSIIIWACDLIELVLYDPRV